MARQAQNPARADQVGVGQGVSVGLAYSAVEGVELGPSVAFAEGTFSDSPEVVVDPVAGWIDFDGVLHFEGAV